MESSEAIIIPLLEHINLLKRLPRTGWLLAGISTAESIADHTCATALLAVTLAEVINVDPQGQGLDAALDVGRLARLALIHDLAEGVLTDLPRISTQLLSAPVKHAAEARAMDGILASLPHGEEYMALWTEYVGSASPEARLVHDADKLEMVHQALCYERSGHRGLDEFWRRHSWYFPLCDELFQALGRLRE